MARRTTETRERPEESANDWLNTHTLQDIRELAQELSASGEDVTELVTAVNELEGLLEETHVEGEAAGTEA